MTKIRISKGLYITLGLLLPPPLILLALFLSEIIYGLIPSYYFCLLLSYSVFATIILWMLIKLDGLASREEKVLKIAWFLSLYLSVAIIMTLLFKSVLENFNFSLV